MENLNELDSRLLISIANRIVPTNTYPRILKNIFIGKNDWSEYDANLTFDDLEAKITFTLPARFQSRLVDAKANNSWGAAVKGVTEENEQFYASNSFYNGSTTTFGSSPEGHRIFIETQNWFLIRNKARMWVTHIEGEVQVLRGNLILEILETSASTGHLYLKGSKYIYYLLKKNKNHGNLLVINSNDLELDLILLDHEIRMLSFCLGNPISCKFLIGYDNEGDITGYAGSSLGFNRIVKNSSNSPIPIIYSHLFLPVFFEKLTSRLAERDTKSDCLLESVWLYVESSSELWINSIEVKLLLACINAAQCFLTIGNLLVKSTDSWEKWIKENTTVLQALAKENNEDIFIANVRKAAVPGVVESIKLALRNAGLEENPELIRAYNIGFLSVFGFLTEIDNPAAIERQKKLRTLCVGLIAAFVGYNGPIQEWINDNDLTGVGKESVNTWWKVESPTEGVPYKAIVEKALQISNPWELWPVFEQPNIPEGSLVSFVEILLGAYHQGLAIELGLEYFLFLY